MPKPINNHHSLLLAKQAELRAVSREPIQIEGKLADPLDEALAASARAVAVDKINRDMTLLRRVEGALDRILGFGSYPYGDCAECDENIPESRLNVVPWAELCVVCQTIQEQKGKGR